MSQLAFDRIAVLIKLVFVVLGRGPWVCACHLLERGSSTLANLSFATLMFVALQGSSC